jgi:hypothetical protein
MITKAQAGYIMVPHSTYTCGECVSYDADDRRCLFLSPSSIVLPFDGCNYFAPGEPESIIPKDGKGLDADGDSAMGLLSDQEAGLVRSNFGFSCKRCANYIGNMFDCQLVDKDSEGATPGMIVPDACCNCWIPDPTNSSLPEEAFSAA